MTRRMAQLSQAFPLLTAERARALIAGFRDSRVLVVGDVMLDQFIVGRVTRISPEAPVPIVVHDHQTSRIGGAANVAHNIVSLGGQATLAGVTGIDDAADTLMASCKAYGITPTLVAEQGRQTTVKLRIVTERNLQVARVDYESDAPLGTAAEDRVMSTVTEVAPSASAIVVSDYLKGCVTPAIMRAVTTAAAAHDIPVLVDPKIPHLESYAGATLITPNHLEAESALNILARTDEQVRHAAERFRARSGCRAVLMTRGDQGIWLTSDALEGYLPAAAREVADVTGAGDTVIATAALVLAAGGTLAEAARLANEAAGVSVGRFGPSVVTPDELLHACRA